MIKVKDKKGQTAYVSHVHDCEDNPDGLYCETYSDDDCGHKIDDFVIRPENIPGFYEMSREERQEAINRYIANYYKDTVLDLNYNF